MSLAIDLDDVVAVLLADGWHEVHERSFSLDSYEYVWAKGTGEGSDPLPMHGGGDNGICSIGFSFREDVSDDQVMGPLTSILAVRVERAEQR